MNPEQAMRPAAGHTGRIDIVQLREFLVPRWIALHEMWPEPVPDPPSRYMCRYTAEFIQLIDPTWAVVFGLVGNETHNWNERPSGFCDLTGDQFGLAPVQTGTTRPRGYVEHRWTDSAPDLYRARVTPGSPTSTIGRAARLAAGSPRRELARG